MAGAAFRPATTRPARSASASSTSRPRRRRTGAPNPNAGLEPVRRDRQQRARRRSMRRGWAATAANDPAWNAASWSSASWSSASWSAPPGRAPPGRARLVERQLVVGVLGDASWATASWATSLARRVRRIRLPRSGLDTPIGGAAARLTPLHMRSVNMAADTPSTGPPPVPARAPGGLSLPAWTFLVLVGDRRGPAQLESLPDIGPLSAKQLTAFVLIAVGAALAQLFPVVTPAQPVVPHDDGRARAGGAAPADVAAAARRRVAAPAGVAEGALPLVHPGVQREQLLRRPLRRGGGRHGRRSTTPTSIANTSSASPSPASPPPRCSSLLNHLILATMLRLGARALPPGVGPVHLREPLDRLRPGRPRRRSSRTPGCIEPCADPVRGRAAPPHPPLARRAAARAGGAPRPEDRPVQRPPLQRRS